MSNPSKIVSFSFPLRQILPRMFNRKYRTRFYLRPRFFDPDTLDEAIEAASVESSPSYPLNGSIDLFILISFDKKEIEKLKKELKGKNREMLCALPIAPGDFQDLVKEIEAILEVMGKSSGSLKGEALEKLRQRVENYINPENLSFYWKGDEIFSKGFKGRNLFYSALLDKLFTNMIPFPMGLSAKDREKVVQEALTLLLDIEKPLVFPRLGGATFNRLLLVFLENNKFCEKVLDTGAYVQFELKEMVPRDSPVREQWELLEQALSGSKEGKDLGNLFFKLQQPSYGLSFHNFLLLLGVFWRAHKGELKLYDTGSGGRRELEPNPQNFAKLLREPQGKKMARESQGDVDKEYFAGLVRLVSPGDAKKVETARDAYAAFSRFINSLPPITRDIVANEGGELQGLYELFCDQECGEGCGETLSKRLLHLMGVEGSSVDELHQRLKDALNRINQAVNVKKERTVQDLGAIFGADGATDEELVKAMKSWYASREKEIEGVEFSPEAMGFLQALSKSGKSGDFLFRDLPKIWDMDEAAKWVRDKYGELLNRIWAARLEIDYWKFRSFVPEAGSSDPRELAKTMVIRYLDIMENDTREKILYLLDLSERLYLGSKDTVKE